VPESAIVVRAARPDDIDALLAMFRQRSVSAMTLQHPYWTQAEWQQRLVSDQMNRILMAEIDGQVAGNAGFHMNARRRSHVASFGMTVLEQFRGRGVGNALMETIIDLADNWFNIVRLELQVYTDNGPAVRLYQRHGFAIEGTHRAYAFRLGEYVDAYTMARLRRPPEVQVYEPE
jgi:L-phenylalanine/L-methionine N-acetyltransferase